jgi:hypothetical protein
MCVCVCMYVGVRASGLGEESKREREECVRNGTLTSNTVLGCLSTRCSIIIVRNGNFSFGDLQQRQPSATYAARMYEM